MIISDAGLPAVRPEQRIELALCEDVPTVTQVLQLVLQELICEKALVAEEQKRYNPRHYEKIRQIAGGCPLELIPHQRLLDEYLPKAKYVVRTGSLEPCR